MYVCMYDIYIYIYIYRERERERERGRVVIHLSFPAFCLYREVLTIQFEGHYAVTISIILFISVTYVQLLLIISLNDHVNAYSLN